LIENQTEKTIYWTRKPENDFAVQHQTASCSSYSANHF